jgi:RNA polymerase sigma factor (sigma-70 family)
MRYSSEEELQSIRAPFETLYKELCSFAEDLIKDPDIGASIVVEKIEKCIKKGFFKEPEELLRKKLFVAVRNGCFDHLRKLRRRRNALALMPPSMNTDVQPITPDMAMIKTELVAKINWLITTLPAEIRSVIDGYYMRRLPVKELARQMNISEPTVYSYRKKGVDMLRERIQRHVPKAKEMFEVIFGS